jgi:probable HAF family extracellular repeat protein
VVVGSMTYNAAGHYARAFRWTVDGGMQDLGTLGGDESEAYGVSADGAVVVGWAQNAALAVACLSLDGLDGGMQDLGTLGGGWSWAYGVSADGAVVVGWAKTPHWQGVPFAGRDGGMQDLGTLGGDESGLMVFPPTAPWWSAGLTTPQGRRVPFAGRDGGMQDLGTLGGDRSWAYGVSADGSVVVGGASNAAGQGRAFRWTASGGMEDLNTTYASLLTNGSVLWARAISPDGRYIVGLGLQRRHRARRSLPAGYGLPAARGCGPQRLRGRCRPARRAECVWRAAATATKTSTGTVSSTTRTC